MAASEERRREAVLVRIHRVRRRLNLEVWLKSAVWPVWVAVTVFVMWRVFVPAGLHLVGPAALLLAAALTWSLSRRHRISVEHAAVVADRQARAGGLLLTRLEVPVGSWELSLNEQLKAIKPPMIDIRRPLSMLGLALCFLATGLLVPQVRTEAKPNVAAAGRIDALAEKTEVLSQEEPVDQAALDELARLEAELTNHSFDAPDWEAADALERQIERQAAEATRELERAEQAANRLERALAESQSEEAQKREREALEAALMELADGKAASAQEALQQATGSSADGGQPKSLNQASVGELREVLERRQAELANKFESGKPENSEQSVAQEKAPSREDKGTGAGVGKGGDTQELVFGDKAELNADRLKFEALPQGHGGQGEQFFGLRSANPQAKPSGGPSPASGGGSSGTQAVGYDEGALRPRNRELVQRYFDTQ